MSRFALWIGAYLASALWVGAQVSVEVALDQTQLLRDESLPVKVRIVNRSGQTLHLGEGKGWLTFTVQNKEGLLVARGSEVPVEGAFELESSSVATRLVELMPYFDLSIPGQYTVTATIQVPQWEREISSRPTPFEIVRGVKIWEEDFGVPGTPGIPEARKYALQQANYLKELTLYVRLTNPSETKVFRVFPIGPLLSFSRPEAQIDRESKLHVLWQTGARSFQYCVVTPDGDLVRRQIHSYTQTRPVLRSRDGEIVVSGGMRRLSRTDIPRQAERSATNDGEVTGP